MAAEHKTTPIRAALDAAEDAAHIAGCPPGSCAHVAAAAVEAFHRALAQRYRCTAADAADYEVDAYEEERMADLVRDAAHV